MRDGGGTSRERKRPRAREGGVAAVKASRDRERPRGAKRRPRERDLGGRQVQRGGDFVSSNGGQERSERERGHVGQDVSRERGSSSGGFLQQTERDREKERDGTWLRKPKERLGRPAARIKRTVSMELRGPNPKS